MTAIVSPAQAISPATFGNQRAPTSQSFYGKRFKALRVTGSALSSLVMAIFYKVLSVACGIAFQKSAHHRYRQLASYHWNRVLNQPVTYGIYGDKVVNFATNSTGTPIKLKSKQANEAEELKKIYGESVEKMRNLATCDDIPIRAEKLSRYPINGGICLGASLDFIARYLQEDADDPFETIAKISKLFSEKGTPEAQITQILYKAQDISQLIDKKRSFRNTLKQELDQDIQNARQRLNATREQFKEAIQTLSKSDQLKFINEELPKVIAEGHSEINQLTNRFHSKIAENNASLDCERLQDLAKANSLQVQLNTVFLDEDVKQKAPPEIFDSRISQLPVGAYLVCLSNSPDSRSGHTIAFIKASDGAAYLFDSNFATLKLSSDELVPELWKLTKKFYNTKGTCNMQIYNCHCAA